MNPLPTIESCRPLGVSMLDYPLATAADDIRCASCDGLIPAGVYGVRVEHAWYCTASCIDNETSSDEGNAPRSYFKGWSSNLMAASRSVSQRRARESRRGRRREHMKQMALRIGDFKQASRELDDAIYCIQHGVWRDDKGELELFPTLYDAWPDNPLTRHASGPTDLS